MKKLLALMVIAAMTLFGVSAFAAVDLKIDDDTFAKFGAKARIQYSTVNPGADKVVVGLGEGRIYFAGQVTNTVKFGFNYDFAVSGAVGAGGGRASDALVMFDLAKELKINTGIYRMAFSRIGLQDSYQYILINSPEVGGTAFVSNGLAGWRVGGVTVWGDLANGMIRYNVGVSDGTYAPTASNEIGMSARVVLNFMDPEKGYTCPGCYLGKAKVANVGLGYFTQDNSAGDVTYTATTVDGFYDANNMTLEGAYFMYDYDTGQKPTGYYAEAAYAMGKIQPAVRYESYDDDVAANDNTDYTKILAGVNYLISGHDAKIGVEYAMKDFDGAGVDTDTLMVQVQVQF